VLKVGNHHFQEIIGLARHEMAGDNFPQSLDCLLELESPFVGVAIYLNADKDGESEADPVTAERPSIPFDVAFALKAASLDGDMGKVTAPPCRQARHW
jgi:hypothetical protein